MPRLQSNVTLSSKHDRKSRHLPVINSTTRISGRTRKVTKAGFKSSHNIINEHVAARKHYIDPFSRRLAGALHFEQTANDGRMFRRKRDIHTHHNHHRAHHVHRNRKRLIKMMKNVLKVFHRQHEDMHSSHEDAHKEHEWHDNQMLARLEREIHDNRPVIKYGGGFQLNAAMSLIGVLLAVASVASAVFFLCEWYDWPGKDTVTERVKFAFGQLRKGVNTEAMFGRRI